MADGAAAGEGGEPPALRPELRRQFGYPEADDLDAARLLHGLVPKRNTFREAGEEVRNRRNLVIAGCGPGLAKVRADLFAASIVVAADGATTRLRELGVVPHVVVTDLDGEPGALRWAADQGSMMVVHAHGDNVPALLELVPQLGPRVRGTHQVAQPGPILALAPLRNVGGFTDGDRAVLLCEALGGLSATLVGFETDQPPSPYSHKWDPATKPAKLAWAERFVQGVQARRRLALRKWMP